MRAVVLGVGEAFDGNVPTNSHLVCSATNLLLDCGYSIPAQLWRREMGPDFLDAIFLSHSHADHYFGMPSILGRMSEDGRSKRLKIICAPEVATHTRQLLEAGYAGLFDKLLYQVEFVHCGPETAVSLNELTLTFAPTVHGAPNLAICVDSAGKRVCYSGDGIPTAAAEQMYQAADLLIHDTYQFEEVAGGHPGILDIIELADRSAVRTLALTHICREIRNDMASLMSRISGLSKDTDVRVPEPGDIFEI